jgi:hypothetical protein
MVQGRKPSRGPWRNGGVVAWRGVAEMSYTCTKCGKEGLLFLLDGGVCSECFVEPEFDAPLERKKTHPRAKYDDRECVHCKEVYTPDWANQSLCSPECKRLWGNKNRSARARGAYVKLEFMPLVCALDSCDEVFTPNVWNKRFCSAECSAEKNRQRSRGVINANTEDI